MPTITSSLSRSISNPELGKSEFLVGWLWKRSKTHPNRWFRRHFRWNGDELSYHHSATPNSVARFTVKADNIARALATPRTYPGVGSNVFSIEVSGGDVVEVAARTREKMDEWLSVLMGSVNARFFKSIPHQRVSSKVDKILGEGWKNQRKRGGVVFFTDKELPPLPTLPKENDRMEGQEPVDMPHLPPLRLDRSYLYQASDAETTSDAGISIGRAHSVKSAPNAAEDEATIPAFARLRRLSEPASPGELDLLIENMFREASEKYGTLTASKPELTKAIRSAGLSPRPQRAKGDGAGFQSQHLASFRGTAPVPPLRKNPLLSQHKSSDNVHRPCDTWVESQPASRSVTAPSSPSQIRLQSPTRPTASNDAEQGSGGELGAAYRILIPVHRFRSSEKLEALMNALHTGKETARPRPTPQLTPPPKLVIRPPTSTAAPPTISLPNLHIKPLTNRRSFAYPTTPVQPPSHPLPPPRFASLPRRNSADSTKTLTKASISSPEYTHQPRSPTKGAAPLLSSLTPLILNPTLNPAAQREAVSKKVVKILQQGTALHKKLNREDEWEERSGDSGKRGTVTHLAARIKARRKALDEYRVAVEDLGRRTRDYVKSLPAEKGADSVDNGLGRRPSAFSVLSGWGGTGVSAAAVDLVESVEVMLMKLAQLREVFAEMV